jgi:hypothetical protein
MNMRIAKRSANKMAIKKKITKKKTAPKKTKVVALKSFKLAKEPAPFMSFKITDQTVYWSILLILILILALWVLNIQINISNVLNTVNGV